MKITIVAVILSIVAVATFAPLQAAQNQQMRPECSIADRDTGASVELDGSALITPLQTLVITCDVGDNSREVPWDFSTELLNPKWSVSDSAGRHPPVFEQSVNLADYSERLEVELTGNVAWPKVPGQFGSEEFAYIAETAPGIRTRVVSFSVQSSPPIHYEVVAAHPDHIKAVQALDALDDRGISIAQYVQPVRHAANVALEQGRPWRAIELIETMNPVLDVATEHRLEYEELRLESQAFWTPGVFIGIGIGVAVAAGCVGLVILVLAMRNRRPPPPPPKRSEEDESGSGAYVAPETTDIDDSSEATDDTRGRRRRRRRRA